MAKAVNLLSYWMPVLRQLKEFKEIAKAEEPELRLLLEACDRTLNNLFITTADESGIAHFERLLRIFPDDGEDLDTRRFNVLIRWSDKAPYTDEELYNRLCALCGEGNFSITRNYDKYAIEISVSTGIKGAFDAVIALVNDMIPCNLVSTFTHIMPAEKTSYPSVGVAISTAMSYQITNDIKSKVTTVATLNSAVVNSVATISTVNTENIKMPTTSTLGEALLGVMVLGTETD